MATLVHYAVAGALARITLDSPHNRNALSSELVDQLHQALRHAVEEPGVRAVVLGHTGGTFCAGADLSEASGAAARAASGTGDAFGAAADRSRQLSSLLRAILELPLPVLAAIDGHVRAGGLGLVGACDIVVAGRQCTFALTEARIGVAPGIISLTLLSKMTPRAAGRYFLTGERFGPDEAAAIGLVTVATDDVASSVAAITAELQRGSPQGLAASKALTTRPILDGFDRRADELSAQSARLFLSEEAREGMLAFLQKRAPRWTSTA
ncbi:MAG: enoyl-CoA hydratase family protein [Mycobacteriaceae bacterium]|nr:enoyl-CoA hydratase family protein [Mycobacteriaceae bacterium]MBV9640097.1 enoyl-CoA hydratase family protein [Mycobacteriaceae bacterium]